jgi:hypothetical protein
MKEHSEYPLQYAAQKLHTDIPIPNQSYTKPKHIANDKKHKNTTTHTKKSKEDHLPTQGR